MSMTHELHLPQIRCLQYFECIKKKLSRKIKEKLRRLKLQFTLQNLA